MMCMVNTKQATPAPRSTVGRG